MPKGAPLGRPEATHRLWQLAGKGLSRIIGGLGRLLRGSAEAGGVDEGGYLHELGNQALVGFVPFGARRDAERDAPGLRPGAEAAGPPPCSSGVSASVSATNEDSDFAATVAHTGPYPPPVPTLEPDARPEPPPARCREPASRPCAAGAIADLRDGHCTRRGQDNLADAGELTADGVRQVARLHRQPAASAAPGDEAGELCEVAAATSIACEFDGLAKVLQQPGPADAGKRPAAGECSGAHARYRFGDPTPRARRGAAARTCPELEPQGWDALLRQQEQQDAALPGGQLVEVRGVGLGRCQRGVELGLADEPGTAGVGANEVGSPSTPALTTWVL